MKPILNPDTTNTSQAYWDHVLRTHNLPILEETYEEVEVDETPYVESDETDEYDEESRP